MTENVTFIQGCFDAEEDMASGFLDRNSTPEALRAMLPKQIECMPDYIDGYVHQATKLLAQVK